MSLKLKNTEKYIEEFAKNVKKKLIYETNRKDRVRSYKFDNITSSITASGQLADSYKIKENRNSAIVKYNIIGNSYGEAVDEGTNSSTAPVQKLVNWLISKNATLLDSKKRVVSLGDIKKVRRIAFAIQKSLSIKGIQRTGFITDLVQKEFKQLKELYKPVVQDIELDIDNILLRAGYKKKDKETYVIETQIK